MDECRLNPVGTPSWAGSGGFLQKRAAAFPWERKRDPMPLARARVGPSLRGGVDGRAGEPARGFRGRPERKAACRAQWGVCRMVTLLCAPVWEGQSCPLGGVRRVPWGPRPRRYERAGGVHMPGGQGSSTGKETQAPRVTCLRRNSRGGTAGARRRGFARGWLQPCARPRLLSATAPPTLVFDPPPASWRSTWGLC